MLDYWTYEIDNERECFRILTAEKVIKSEDGDDHQWVADVFDENDAVEIINHHNLLVTELREKNES